MAISLVKILDFDDLQACVCDPWWKDVLDNWKQGKLGFFLGVKKDPLSADGIYIQYTNEANMLIAREIVFVLQTGNDFMDKYNTDWAMRYGDRVVTVKKEENGRDSNQKSAGYPTKDAYCEYCKEIKPHRIVNNTYVNGTGGHLICTECGSSRLDTIQGFDAALM